MKTKKTIANMLVLLLVVSAITCVFIPMRANATTGLIALDFLNAKLLKGQYTEKGISYQEMGDSNVFVMKPGEYILLDNIDLQESIMSEEEGTYVFNLNGKTLTTNAFAVSLYIMNADVTIKGNGTITNNIGLPSVALYDGNFKIENGTFNGYFLAGSSKKDSSLVILDANMPKGICLRGEKMDAVINDGVFNSDMGAACHATEGVTLTINNGEFTSSSDGLYAVVDYTKDPQTMKNVVLPGPKSVTINGGTFKSTGEDDEAVCGGVFFSDYDNVTINGGAFIGEGNAFGGLCATVSDGSPEDKFNSFLGQGRNYSEALKVDSKDSSDGKKVYYTQGTISVTGESVSEDEKSLLHSTFDKVSKIHEESNTI
ncbi:MAG: carbohydrate-binding domain-containing protein [Lachnospiraceae bacterium]|nr:carbohydrate-binding domain-containing protein [Lachnospiraceae bacterium]